MIAAARYLLVGTIFGLTLVKGEVVSWFRIQEMFRFESPHMYLIMGTALFVASVSLEILKRRGAVSLTGDAICMTPKKLGRGVRYIVGGVLFGIGWSFTGACPGPLFALFGSGVTVFVLTIASALFGTWVYGVLRPRLPH